MANGVLSAIPVAIGGLVVIEITKEIPKAIGTTTKKRKGKRDPLSLF